GDSGGFRESDRQGPSVRRPRRGRFLAVRDRRQRLPRPAAAGAPSDSRSSRGDSRAAGSIVPSGSRRRKRADLARAAAGRSRRPVRALGGTARGAGSGSLSRAALCRDCRSPGHLRRGRQDADLSSGRDLEEPLFTRRGIMECSELTEKAVTRLLGDLGESEVASMEEHAARCAACRQELVQIETAWQKLGEDLDAPMTSDFRRRSLQLIEEEMLRRRVHEFRPRSPWIRVAAQAAALLAAAALGWFMRRPAAAPAAPSVAPALAPASSAPLQRILSNVTYQA